MRISMSLLPGEPLRENEPNMGDCSKGLDGHYVEDKYETVG